MNKTCKFYWGLAALLIVAVAGLGYLFLNPGNLKPTDDGRTAIMLTAAERDLVLAEMRSFLEGIEAITVGMADKDMAAIAKSAKNIGMATAGQVPLTLMAKLPSEFRSLGMATHQAFDALAVEAEDMGDGQVILSGLAELINNCTTCHRAYRIDLDTRQGVRQ